MLSFAPATRFLHSQILCRLQKVLQMRVRVNQGPLCVKRSRMHVKDPEFPVGFMDYGNPKIIQHALKLIKRQEIHKVVGSFEGRGP